MNKLENPRIILEEAVRLVKREREIKDELTKIIYPRLVDLYEELNSVLLEQEDSYIEEYYMTDAKNLILVSEGCMKHSDECISAYKDIQKQYIQWTLDHKWKRPFLVKSGGTVMFVDPDDKEALKKAEKEHA